MKEIIRREKNRARFVVSGKLGIKLDKTKYKHLNRNYEIWF